MKFPANEIETIALYKLVQSRLGWHIKYLQKAFPDALIENRNGKVLIAEFEYLANNFQLHGHDPAACDLIICWHNNWVQSPLPIWALERIADEESKIICSLIAKPHSKNIWLRGQVATLEQALYYAILENSILRERLGMATCAIEEISPRVLYNLF